RRLPVHRPQAPAGRAQHELMTSTGRGPFFVDSSGGGLSALAVGVARSLGQSAAVAATTSDAIAVPPEVATVLEEIGAALPPVVRAEDLGEEDAPRIDPAPFSLPLHAAKDDLARLAVARIARDRIERHLSLEGAAGQERASDRAGKTAR